MQLYILTPVYNGDEIVGYELSDMIDAAESVLWRKKYNDSGECEIYIPCSEELLALLKKGNYVFRYDDDMFCRIRGLEIETDAEDGDHIISTATDICEILTDRIVRWQITYSGTVGGFIEKLLVDNVTNPKQEQRKIKNFALNFDPADFPEEIEVTAFADDLLDRIKTTCKAYNLGYRVSYDIEADKLLFKLYRGKNRASTAVDGYVEFSPAYSNILSTRYKTSDLNFKNVVYVQYKNEAGETALLSRYKGQKAGRPEPVGEARKEYFLDASNTSRDITLAELQLMFPAVQRNPATTGLETTGYYYLGTVGADTEQKVATFEVTTSDGAKTEKITITDHTYLLLITTIADISLDERNETEEFTGEVDTTDTYIYGENQDYYLGDTVRAINEYGLQADAQIVEVLESDDNDNGHIFEPVFEFKN